MTDAKRRMLDEKCNQYNFDRNIYFNQADKKIFTQNVVDDHDIDWFLFRLAKKNTSGWIFYSNNPIDPKVKQAILNELA